MSSIGVVDRPGGDSPMIHALRRAVAFICRHWLWLANASLVVFAALPLLAPIFAVLGADGLSVLIFQVYSITCHQMPSRSYFLFGHQMAYCERNTAIYGAMAVGGLAYVWLRRRQLNSLPISWYMVLILPMAIDGLTQLFGLRESTWLLRGLTGALFGTATIWLTFPRLQESFGEIEGELSALESGA
ncbi:MAG TPA: DUF2085 domain-containing protein [Chloroflexota bacterium]|nr:DUF2085 domain-containing protein [Chloroflexota bacterium]